MHFSSGGVKPPQKEDYIEKLTEKLLKAKNAKEEAKGKVQNLMDEITMASEELAKSNREEKEKIATLIQELKEQVATQNLIIAEGDKRIKELEEAIEEEKSSYLRSILTRILQGTIKNPLIFISVCGMFCTALYSYTFYMNRKDALKAHN